MTFLWMSKFSMVFEMIFIQPETGLEEQAPCSRLQRWQDNASVVHNQFVAKQITSMNHPSVHYAEDDGLNGYLLVAC